MLTKSHQHAQPLIFFFFFLKHEKGCQTLRFKFSWWSFSSLTAGLPNAYTKFLIPCCHSPIPYFPQPFLGVAIQWSHTHTGRPKRQTADRRRYYSTWPWANYTTDTPDTSYCVAFKKYFNSWISTWKLSIRVVSIILELCTKLHAWKVLANFNPLMSEYFYSYLNKCIVVFFLFLADTKLSRLLIYQ